MTSINSCQSCGMPLAGADNLCGTNGDGSINKNYCNYCYQNGEYTTDLSMEKMIEIFIPHVVSANQEMNAKTAKKMLEEYLPTLERWQ
ncbi:MAG: zinc ribbon domain-containing protein [Halarsenatibacteraceae bacterium]